MMSAARADVAVVGLGLIGAAALRHLSDQRPGAQIVGVGSAEPADFTTHEGVFASHYDSGRITRKLDRRPEWARLAIRSMANYGEIEQRSGIAFHRPAGLLMADDNRENLAAITSVANNLGVDFSTHVIATEGQPEPRLRFAVGHTVLREPGPAGHIDPRRLIAAQLAIASADGARIERREVARLERVSGSWQVIDTDDHLIVEARHVIVAPGPHTDELGGLPGRPHLRVHAETVIMAVLGPAEAARLAGIPSGFSRIDHPVYEDFYCVPPTDYPDGSMRFKMGATMHHTLELNTAAERRAWMRGAAHIAEFPAMRAIVEDLIPGLVAERWETRPCMITETPTRLPYLEIIADGLVIAAGGNGYAAKSSDAIGAIAAGLAVNGRWTDAELDASAFRVVARS